MPEIIKFVKPQRIRLFENATVNGSKIISEPECYNYSSVIVRAMETNWGNIENQITPKKKNGESDKCIG